MCTYVGQGTVARGRASLHVQLCRAVLKPGFLAGWCKHGRLNGMSAFPGPEPPAIDPGFLFALLLLLFRSRRATAQGPC